MRATFRGPTPHPAIPPPPYDADRAKRLRGVLIQLGFEAHGHCRRCDGTQLFVGLTDDGLCLACSLILREERGSVIYWRDQQIDRLARDTEPMLSSERDTRDTEPAEPCGDWAE